jgi:hypothetical protein
LISTIGRANIRWRGSYCHSPLHKHVRRSRNATRPGQYVAGACACRRELEDSGYNCFQISVYRANEVIGRGRGLSRRRALGLKGTAGMSAAATRVSGPERLSPRRADWQWPIQKIDQLRRRTNNRRQRWRMQNVWPRPASTSMMRPLANSLDALSSGRRRSA